MHCRPCLILVGLAAGLIACSGPAEHEARPVIDLTGGPGFPLDAHLESERIAAGEYDFEQLFEAGRELFHASYNGHDGVGISRLPDGTPLNRFSVPPTGGMGGGMVSSQSCIECHNHPHAAAAGLASTNRAGDPDKDGLPPFFQRATTSLWGNGVVQLLAQEMTEELQAIRDELSAEAVGQPGTPVERALVAKGIAYGTLSATASASGEVSFDTSRVEGIDPDLVVRPLLWKGLAPTVRVVTVGAAAGLMGMPAEELVWFPPPNKEYTPDPDGDGVEREFSVGDITAMTVYGASQEIPQSVGRLAELGMVEALDPAVAETVQRGSATFEAIGCAGCHTPELRLENTVFEEPTRRGNGHYYHQPLADKDPSYDPERPLRFDLLVDSQEPRLEAHPDGGAVVRLYGDLKRHRMGRALADPPGPQAALTANLRPLMMGEEKVLVAADVWLTPELWGVASTGPWLHDARAGTLDEAIRYHGEDDPPPPDDPGRSEAQESRDAYLALSREERDALLMFLRSLRTYEPLVAGN